VNGGRFAVVHGGPDACARSHFTALCVAVDSDTRVLLAAALTACDAVLVDPWCQRQGPVLTATVVVIVIGVIIIIIIIIAIIIIIVAIIIIVTVGGSIAKCIASRFAAPSS
jgi:hypothetical protein